MARKAKASTRAQPSPAKSRLPPLDDPRWRTAILQHKLIVERGFDPEIAALALSRALASDKLPSKWERPADGESALTPPGFWDDYQLFYRRPDGLGVTRHRGRSKEANLMPMPPGGVVFCVWGPAADKIWPPLAASTPQPEPKADPQPEKVRVRKPGKPEAYDWSTIVAMEVIRRLKAGEKNPTNMDMIEHCEKVLPGAYSPGLKEMQILLKRLLSGQF